jgi:hypothetical protein
MTPCPSAGTVVNQRAVATPVRRASVQVEGQTSGTWVQLGELTLLKGRSSYVEVSAAGTAGVVAADAGLLVPVK